MRVMRFVLAAAALLITTAAAQAQSSHGYIFAGPGGASNGGTQSGAQAGGGFEVMARRYIGVGAEGGWTGSFQRFGSGVAFVSPNGYFHFAGDRLSGVDPYVTAGYTLLFRDNFSKNAVNYGVGLNWWTRDDLGVKLEFRDHVGNDRHYWAIRFGLTFR